MKKIISILFLITLLLFTSIISSPIIQAEENQPVGFSKVCLDYCSGSETDEHKICPENDLNELKATSLTDAENQLINHHRVLLTGEGLPPNQDIYIVGCIDEEGKKCTSGNNDLDEYLSKFITVNSYSDLKKSTGYVFAVKNNPVKSSSDGKVRVIAASATPNSTQHRFFAAFPLPTEIIEGRGASTQYATFTGEEDVTKCASITWDPEGRIFDSLSLEPIPNISISILSSPSKILVKSHPPTEADGQFNFFVEPGSYILDIVVPANYRFANNPTIHPNYTKAYYNLYKPNEIIIEKAGEVQHRDIPLEPIGTPLRAPNSKIMNWGQISSVTQTKYSGKASHPLSLIALFTKNTNHQVGPTLSADKFGRWEIVLDNKDIPVDEPLEPKATKVDLTTLNDKQGGIIQNLISYLVKKLSKQISAQTLQTAPKKQKQIAFSPILHYLDGYAYDEKGEIIPRAKVKVKLKMSDGVYYQTTADEKGYFVIKPQYLPVFEYYLQFETPTKTIKQTTDQFAKNNKQYLAANKINLMTATKNNQPITSSPTAKITTSASPTKSFSSQHLSSPTSPTSLPNQPSKSTTVTSNTIYFLIGLFLFGLMIAGGIFFYLKKKSSQF